MNHSLSLAGHPGRNKTIELVSRNFWWPTLSSDVEQFVATCDACQRAKSRNRKEAGLLRSLPIPSYPWQHVTMAYHWFRPHGPLILLLHDFWSSSLCKQAALEIRVIAPVSIPATHFAAYAVISMRGNYGRYLGDERRVRGLGWRVIRSRGPNEASGKELLRHEERAYCVCLHARL